MKFRLLIMFLLITFSSCESDSIQVKDPQKETTISIQQLAEKDTTLYKIVQIGNEIYCINVKTNLVEKKITDYKYFVGAVLFILVLALILAVIFL